MTPALWYVAIYSMLIGVLMIGWWSAALLRGVVPEVAEGSREIWFHIIAEGVTGFTLLAGGLATLAVPEGRSSALLSALGIGLLCYSLITSPGYYVEQGDRAMTAMFGFIWILTIPAIVLRFA